MGVSGIGSNSRSYVGYTQSDPGVGREDFATTLQRHQKQSGSSSSGTYGTSFQPASGRGSMGLDGQNHRPPFLDAAAETLGLSPDELDQELKSGKTLEEVASDQGVSADTLRETLTQDIQQNFPNDRGAPSSDEVSSMVDSIMTRSGPSVGGSRAGGPEGPGGSTGKPPFLDAVASKLGISSDELDQELRSGKSFETIAANHGKSSSDIESILTQDFKKAHPDATDDQVAQAIDQIMSGPRLVSDSGETELASFRARDLQRLNISAA